MADPDLSQNGAGRKQAEEVLRERDELFRVLTDHANDFIRLHDLDGRSVYASPSVERFYGRVPTTVFDFTHPEDVENCQRWWKKVLAGGTDRLHWRVRDAGGHWRWLETSAALVRYHDRPHVLTVCRDITDRRRAEEQSRVAAERLRAVVAAAPMAIWAVDRSGIKTLSEGNLLAKWGREPNEMVGRSIFEAAKGVPELLDAARRVLSGESVSGVTTVEDETFEWWYYPLRADDGAVTGAVGVALDVTDRRRAEDGLRESERKLNEAQRLAHLGYWENDFEADRVSWSDETGRILGLPPDNGRPAAGVRELVHPDDRPSFDEAFARALRGNQTTTRNFAWSGPAARCGTSRPSSM
ncbi:MAG: Blue-light-activated protein [Gemmataceae bacterium]|nr:Blue-light-activated protein [Gemmataceae bacterium]